jgi:glycerol-3-phosphate O-acyltransferase
LQQLGYQIVYQLTDALVITPPAILASVLLMDRIGISDDKLSEKARWLCQEITSRGIRVARTQSDSSISISNTLALMGDVVNKSKKDMFEVQVSFDQNSFIQLFTLTYYRNTLTHIFFEEGIIIVSLASFGYQ